MEDGLTAAEGIVRNPLCVREGDSEQENLNQRDDENKNGGFISHLISNFVAGGEAGEEKGGKLREAGDFGEERETKEEKGGGGIMNHLLSSLIPSSSPTPETGETNKRKLEDYETVDGVKAQKLENGVSESERCEAGSGGILSNIITNFFHHSEDGEGAHEKKENIEEEKLVDNGKEREGGGGGGIIDKLVSHLPASLPGDAAPKTDEASILISIARD